MISYDQAYIRQILHIDPFETQLLSIIDVSINIKTTADAIVSGLFDKPSLLDNPFIGWDPNKLHCNNQKELAQSMHDL